MNSSELQDQLEKYHHESYGWALSCCLRDPLEAEDVLQAVYLKVLEGQARYNGRATLKTWLFAVIRKTAANERRQKMFRRLWLVKCKEIREHIAQGENPDDAIYRSEIQTLFRRALSVLPRRQQEVLQLVFDHDLSLEEAAEVMGISLGSARTHYDRGKKRLRQWIEQSGGLDEPEFK